MKKRTMVTMNFTEGVEASVRGMSLEDYKNALLTEKEAPYDVNTHLPLVKGLIGKLEKKFNSFMGVEFDSLFDNMSKYDSEFTLLHGLMENMVDELFIVSEELRYWERGNDYWGLNKTQTRAYGRKLKRFITEEMVNHFKPEEQLRYLSSMSKYTV